LITETVLQTYRYKITLDYGSAYHFRFLEHLPDDPYGPMVDRCARIAKYAGAGTVICTGEYRNQLGNPAAYVSIGSVPLRGFRNPEELFSRSLVEVDSEEYLNPSFSTRGVSDPGRGSKWTSWLKGLHYKSDLSVLI